MTITTKQRLVTEVVCDECGNQAEEHDAGPTYWFSEDAARADLTEDGWHLTETRHLCPRCAANEVCAQVGHDWDAWWTPDPAAWPGRKAQRFCRRECSNGFEVADPDQVIDVRVFGATGGEPA